MRSRSPLAFTRRAALIGAGAAALAPREAAAQLTDAPVTLAGRGCLSVGLFVIRGGGDVPLLRAEGRTVDGRAYTNSMPFRIASISKLFTAFGAAILAADGALSLDMDIAEALGPAFRHPAHPTRPITPRMLMSHTSGLRNGQDFPVPAGLSLTERLARAAAEKDYAGWFAPAETPPGWFNYSDTNSAALAQLIEAVTGQRFDLFMTERIFGLGGPRAIGYNWSGVAEADRGLAAAGARYLNGAWTPQVDETVPEWPQIALYAGGQNPPPSLEALALAQNGFSFAPHGGLRASLLAFGGYGHLFARNGATAVYRALAPAYRLLAEGAAWTYDPQSPNGDTADGFFQSYGLGPQRLVGVSGPGHGDALFGKQSHEWMGHAGDAYGWITGLWWNTRTQAVVAYAINGVPETGRDPGRRSAFLAAEEELADEALAALNG